MDKGKMKKGLRVILVMGMIIALTGCGLLKDFDATAYVKGSLDQQLKGEVKELAKIVKDTTEEELTEDYNMSLDQVAREVMTELQVDESQLGKYKEFFAKMLKEIKYDVKEARKINDNEYEVDVTYQPIDFYTSFESAMIAYTDTWVERVASGELQGTEEEIMAQLTKELADATYGILETAYENATVLEEQTYTFHVKAGDDKIFEVPEAEMTAFGEAIIGVK